MKKNSGFTLIELIGVIIVLTVIALIAYPSVEKTMRDSRQDLYDSQIVLLETALEQYAVMHRSELPKTDGDHIQVTLRQLVDDGLVDENLKNPLTGDPFTEDDLDMKIIRYHNNYTYHVNK